jgi:uncharacterized membrane protein (DUF485 family)
MKILIVIVVLIMAAVLLRLYAPQNQGISYQVSPGVSRGIPLNVVAFWLVMIIAIGVAAAYVVRRVL